jgi:hypothetical protein
MHSYAILVLRFISHFDPIKLILSVHTYARTHDCREKNKKNSRFAGRAKPESKCPHLIQMQLTNELKKLK